MNAQARITLYIMAILSGAATLAAMAGVADYDIASGMVTIHPFNITWLGGVVAPVLASALATVAAWLGWKPRVQK